MCVCLHDLFFTSSTFMCSEEERSLKFYFIIKSLKYLLNELEVRYGETTTITTSTTSTTTEAQDLGHLTTE